MLHPRHKKQWNDFVINIESHVNTKSAFISAIITWISANMTKLDEGMIKKYKLDIISSLEPEHYPVEASEFDPKVEFSIMREHPPINYEAFISKLSETIWELISYRTGMMCPTCDSDELKALYDPNSSQNPLVLACDRCGWAQLPNGTQWNGILALRAMTKEQLRIFGYAVD